MCALLHSVCNRRVLDGLGRLVIGWIPSRTRTESSCMPLPFQVLAPSTATAIVPGARDRGCIQGTRLSHCGQDGRWRGWWGGYMVPFATAAAWILRRLTERSRIEAKLALRPAPAPTFSLMSLPCPSTHTQLPIDMSGHVRYVVLELCKPKGERVWEVKRESEKSYIPQWILCSSYGLCK